MKIFEVSWCMILVTVLILSPSLASAQEADDSGEFRLASPLVEGSPAPFSGILLSEDDFRLALELDARASRWEREARVFQQQLEVERRLFEDFISDQRNRINELSEQDWWDENGNWVMLGLGLVVGVVVSAVLVGLAAN